VNIFEAQRFSRSQYRTLFSRKNKEAGRSTNFKGFEIHDDPLFYCIFSFCL